MTGDAGGSATAEVDAAPSPDVDPSPGQVADFCDVLHAYASRCNAQDACTTTSITNCTTYGSAGPASQGGYSAAFVAALGACLSTTACDPSASPMSPASACFESALAAITPTPVQQQVAVTYCAQCATAYAQTTAQCGAAYFVPQTGNGIVVLAYDDEAAKSVADCAANENSCGGYFPCTQKYGAPDEFDVPCLIYAPPGD